MGTLVGGQSGRESALWVLTFGLPVLLHFPLWLSDSEPTLYHSFLGKSSRCGFRYGPTTTIAYQYSFGGQPYTSNESSWDSTGPNFRGHPSCRPDNDLLCKSNGPTPCTENSGNLGCRSVDGNRRNIYNLAGYWSRHSGKNLHVLGAFPATNNKGTSPVLTLCVSGDKHFRSTLPVSAHAGRIPGDNTRRRLKE